MVLLESRFAVEVIITVVAPRWVRIAVIQGSLSLESLIAGAAVD